MCAQNYSTIQSLIPNNNSALNNLNAKLNATASFMYSQNQTGAADTFTPQNKEVQTKKGIKPLAVLGIGAAVAAVGAGIIYALHKNKITNEAKALSKSANELIETVSKKIEEVTQIFNNTEKNADSKSLVRITENAIYPDNKLLEELADDGMVKRMSKFIDGNLVTMEEYTGNKTKNLLFIENNNGIIYSQGLQLLPDGKQTAAKRIEIQAGKPVNYIEKFECLKNETISAAKMAEFSEEGRITTYMKDMVLNSGETKPSCKKKYIF